MMESTGYWKPRSPFLPALQAESVPLNPHRGKRFLDAFGQNSLYAWYEPESLFTTASLLSDESEGWPSCPLSFIPEKSTATEQFPRHRGQNLRMTEKRIPFLLWISGLCCSIPLLQKGYDGQQMISIKFIAISNCWEFTIYLVSRQLLWETELSEIFPSLQKQTASH